MASRAYFYALVRRNSLLRAQGWGAAVDENSLNVDVNDNFEGNLVTWSNTYYQIGNGMFLRFIYLTGVTDGDKSRQISVQQLRDYADTLRPGVINVLVLENKISKDAQYVMYRHFPYVYKFTDFIVNGSVWDSSAQPVGDDILRYLSKSNVDRPETVIPIKHRDLSLYNEKDVVPFIIYMKRENTIFEIERQPTIPGVYGSITYRYVGKHFTIPVKELDDIEERKEKKKEMGKRKREEKKATSWAEGFGSREFGSSSFGSRGFGGEGWDSSEGF